MSKVYDVREGGGDFVILGKALVLPSSTSDGADLPLNGSIRYNPDGQTVEVYTDNSWFPLGSGEGGSAVHTHVIAQITGLQAALDAKSPVAHVHTQSEITGLLAALSGKAAVLHQHNVDDILNLETRLTSIQASVTSVGSQKANASHVHTIGNITGLQTALDNKTNVLHTHLEGEVIGLTANLTAALRREIRFEILGTPASQLRYPMVFAGRVRIPRNFVGSVARVRVFPTANYIIQIRHNGVVAGTLTISTLGTAVFTTVSTVGIILNSGDVLDFGMPAQDATLDTLSVSILGTNQ